jgi:hypothetical protein
MLKTKMQARDTDTSDFQPNQILRTSVSVTESPRSGCQYLAKVVTITYKFENLAPGAPQESSLPSPSVAEGAECITVDADDAERKATAKAVGNMRIDN